MLLTRTHQLNPAPTKKHLHVQPGTTLAHILKPHMLQNMGRYLTNSRNPTKQREAAKTAVKNRLIKKLQWNETTRNYHVLVQTETSSTWLTLKATDTNLRPPQPNRKPPIAQPHQKRTNTIKQPTPPNTGEPNGPQP